MQIDAIAWVSLFVGPVRPDSRFNHFECLAALSVQLLPFNVENWHVKLIIVLSRLDVQESCSWSLLKVSSTEQLFRGDTVSHIPWTMSKTWELIWIGPKMKSLRCRKMSMGHFQKLQKFQNRTPVNVAKPCQNDILSNWRCPERPPVRCLENENT